MTTLVYKYGLLAPIQLSERVREQMRLAHVYRNTLTQIERGRRDAVRGAMSAYADIAVLELAASAALATEEDAGRALKAERATTRARSETEAQRTALKDARERRKDVVARLRTRRTELREDAALVAEVDRINGLANDLAKSARAYCGVYWGTYLLAEDAMQAARKAPLHDGAEPSDPRFVRWTGEGKVGVQLQGGLDVADAFGSDTQIQIRPVPERKPRPDGRSRFAELWMRVGSDGRAPVWAVWPMVLHRPLPGGAVIKRATVSLRKRGPREEWTVEITVALSDAVPLVGCGVGAVAVDIGWRKVPGGLRVAYVVGEDGAAEEFVLDDCAIGGIRKADDLRSIRDRNFDAARDALKACMDAWLGACVMMPDWLRVATATLGQWKSPGRLAALVLRWKANRFEGDAAVYETV